jgi:hypothetical protein
MSKLIYCATPSRISDKKNQIMDFVVRQGYAPFHPFQAFPYELFEGNPFVGREKTMMYCLRAIEICDEFWLFGVSQGTILEANHALKISKPTRRYLEEFDPKWRSFYQKLKNLDDNVKRLLE